MNEENVFIDFYSDKDREDYTNFLLRNPDSNIYHTIDWKEVLEEYFNLKPLYLIACDSNKNIRAILPMFYISSLVGKRLESLPRSIYCGVLGEEEYIKPLIKKVFEIKKEMKYSCAVFRQLPGYDHLFKDLDLKKIENKWNQCIELKHPDILWREIEKSNRNRIRKARNDKITTERVENREYLKDVYRLELFISRNIGISIPSLSFFEIIWDKMHSKGMVEVFVAKHNDRVIASTLIFPFNRKVVCRIANSDIKFKNPGVNNLLLWDAIVWSYNEGYDFFDLGATDMDNPGLFFFKSTFSTYNCPFSYYYYPKDTIRVSDEILFKFGRKILQKMPIKFFEKISPFLVRKFL